MIRANISPLPLPRKLCDLDTKPGDTFLGGKGQVVLILEGGNGVILAGPGDTFRPIPIKGFNDEYARVDFTITRVEK